VRHDRPRMQLPLQLHIRRIDKVAEARVSGLPRCPSESETQRRSTRTIEISSAKSTRREGRKVTYVARDESLLQPQDLRSAYHASQRQQPLRHRHLYRLDEAASGKRRGSSAARLVHRDDDRGRKELILNEGCVPFKFSLVCSPADHPMPTRRRLHGRPRVHAYDTLEKKNNEAFIR